MNNKLYIVFFTHFIYGMVFNMFGPLVPYLAESINKLQSQFTYMFLIRGVAYLVAGFSQKGFLSQFNPVKRLMVSCVVSGICFGLFQHFYENKFISSIICVAMFLGNGSMQVLINVLLTSSSSEDAKKAISFSYGFYGFGGIMGSVIVSIIGINALYLSAILTASIGILYIFFSQSKRNEEIKEIKEKMIGSQQTIEVEEKKVKYLSHEIEMTFCVLFCLYSSISLSYRSWVPSFIVMENLASKQVAAISVSIYSAFLTVFRFVFMFWSPDVIKTLNYSTIILIGTLIVSIFSFFLDFHFILIYGSSIVLGMIFSSYVPYIYALPSEFKLSFTQNGTCNTIIAYAVGEAVISALIGCLMDWIDPIMLFVMMLLFSLMNKFYVTKTIRQLQKYHDQQINNNKQLLDRNKSDKNNIESNI